MFRKNHSARNALTGSTRVARRAGNKQATNATAIKINVTAYIVRKIRRANAEKKALQQASAGKHTEQTEKDAYADKAHALEKV